MPLRCINQKGDNIHSFDLPDDQWDMLKQENKKSYHLKMPCCDANVVLKQSRLGTRFFAHKTKGNCVYAPETEEHHYLKRAVMIAARKNGWKSQTEVKGVTPSGEEWIADVLAQKGKHKIAIEIQWSGQTNEETLRRQQRYKESGIRGLWLLRQPGFPVTRDLPAICIGGNLKEGFVALIPSHDNMNTHDRRLKENWQEVLKIEKFFEAVFSGYFQFGLPLNSEINIILRAKKKWCSSCKSNPQILFMLDLNYSGNLHHGVFLDFFYKHNRIINRILKSIPSNYKLGLKKLKHKVSFKRKELENTCYFCGNFIDYGVVDFFKKPLYEYQEISRVSFKSSTEWQGLLDGYCGKYWRVVKSKN